MVPVYYIHMDVAIQSQGYIHPWHVDGKDRALFRRILPLSSNQQQLQEEPEDTHISPELEHSEGALFPGECPLRVEVIFVPDLPTPLCRLLELASAT